MIGSGGVGGPYTFHATGLRPGLPCHQRHHFGNGHGERDVQLHGHSEGFGGRHGHGELLVMVAPPVSATCRVDHRRAGRWPYTGHDDCSARHRRPYTFSAHGSAAGITMSPAARFRERPPWRDVQLPSPSRIQHATRAPVRLRGDGGTAGTPPTLICPINIGQLGAAYTSSW